MFLKAQMPNHHLLNGLFSHGGREKYPPAAFNWVLVVLNLIHTYTQTYIHIDNYMPLVDSLHRVYPGYRFQVVPVIIGALGTIPMKLKTNLKMIGLTSEALSRFIEHGQKLPLLGTLKITKNFQKH